MKWLMIIAVLALIACSKIDPEGTVPEDCADGEDNDKDGDFDCEDKGCTTAENCLKVEKERTQKPVENLESTSKTDMLTGTESLFVEEDGLLIQVGHNGTEIAWKNADNYCRNLNLSGKTGWRLPTEKEALKIVNNDKIAKDSSYVMWTSDKKSDQKAVIVGITGGAVNVIKMRSKGECRARCVLGASQ